MNSEKPYGENVIMNFVLKIKFFFDIQRTRRAYNLTTGDFPDILTYQNESGITFTEKYLL